LITDPETHPCPADAGDPRSQRVEFVQTRGLRFEVITAGAGDKLALLLHGFPECAYSWRHQIPALVRLGYRVWAPNLRGYGRTDRPGGIGQYRVDKLEQDVHDLIDASGATSTLLVGHDWGAIVAWNVAMYRARPIERLVIMNVPHPALMLRGLLTWKQIRKSWYIFFFQLPRVPERLIAARHYRAIERVFRGMAVDQSRFPDEVVDVFKRNAAEPGALTAMINYYRAIPGALGLTRRRGSPTIDVPTLLVWGEADSVLGKELTEGTGRYVSDLTVRYLPRISHWVQQEAPEAVNAILDAWLTGREVPDAGGALDVNA